MTNKEKELRFYKLCKEVFGGEKDEFGLYSIKLSNYQSYATGICSALNHTLDTFNIQDALYYKISEDITQAVIKEGGHTYFPTNAARLRFINSKIRELERK